MQTSPHARCVLKRMSLFPVTRFERKTRSRYPRLYYRPPNSQFFWGSVPNFECASFCLVVLFERYCLLTFKHWEHTASLALRLRRPPQERKIPGSNLACAGIFSRSSHTSDLKIGTPVATLPGAWRYRVSAGTGWPGTFSTPPPPPPPPPSPTAKDSAGCDAEVPGCY